MSAIAERQSSATWDSDLQAAQAAEQSGRWDDALRLYQSSLDLMPAERAEERPKVLRFLGRVHFERGEYESAAAVFERSLAGARDLNQPRAAASALNSIAVVAQFRGRLDLAEEAYRRSATLAEEVGDARLCALIAQNLGTLCNTRGDLSTALLHYQTALKHFRAAGDQRGASWVLNNMGMLHIDVEEWSAAELCFQSAYVLADQNSDQATLAKIAINRADLHLKRQNYERARECCDEALRIMSALASSVGLAEVHKCYGVLYRETGRSKAAHLQFLLALELAKSCDNPLLEAEVESERGRSFLNERSYRGALMSFNRAYSLFSELGARREILDLQARLQRLEQSYTNAVDLWLDEVIIPEGEPIHRRGRRVAQLAVRLARAVDHRELSTLRIACHLLDIGNAAVPAELLERSGPLDANERETVRAHTMRGDELLGQTGFPADVRSIVRYHHERWDGQGYPDGLAGADIPLAARIAGIADVYDALTTPRAYRAAYAPYEAIRMMQEDAGRQFDPELFAKFRAMLQSDPTHDHVIPAFKAWS
jgi:HD-GYP domain-containing protein (c-di-GMP phosphodiesterase class II)/Flp pilus assembly protein TadD